VRVSRPTLFPCSRDFRRPIRRVSYHSPTPHHAFLSPLASFALLTAFFFLFSHVGRRLGPFRQLPCSTVAFFYLFRKFRLPLFFCSLCPWDGCVVFIGLRLFFLVTAFFFPQPTTQRCAAERVPSLSFSPPPSEFSRVAVAHRAAPSSRFLFTVPFLLSFFLWRRQSRSDFLFFSFAALSNS